MANMYGGIASMIANEIADMRGKIDEYQMELAECFAIAQMLDAENPDIAGAFTGTPSERIRRQLISRGIAKSQA